MSRRVMIVCPPVLLVLVLAASLQAQQAFLIELKTEHDPGRRSDKALAWADSLFDGARDFYAKGDIHKGDANLEDMTTALQECVESLGSINKSRNYKKAELHVAALLRRMDGLVADLSMEERGWAEYTQRKVDQIHDELLQGVMRR